MNIPEFSPPMLNGVTASKVYLPKSFPQPLSIYEYLSSTFSHISKCEWEQRFKDGLVFNAKGVKLSINSEYEAETHVFYYRFLAHETHVPFEHKIIFENDHLLIVDKPHFLTISPTGQYVQETLLVRLKKQTNNESLTPIHRLDRETAGIVLFSKKAESRGIYQQMFAEREVEKTYHAIAPYKSDLIFPQKISLRMEKGEPFYTMKVTDGFANSETEISIIDHDKTWAKYKLKPTSGKQHQLRLHLSFLGIPIKNDPFYPVVNHKAEDDFSSPLQLLAKEISFIDPITCEKMFFESQLELTM